MDRPSTRIPDRDKRRELLIETSRRRLQRTQEKLDLVRLRLQNCTEEERARWTLAERELAESCRAEQGRLHKLEGDSNGLPSVELDARFESVEVPPSIENQPAVAPAPQPTPASAAAPELEAKLASALEQLNQALKDLELARAEVSALTPLRAQLQSTSSEVERQRLEIEDLARRLADENAANELLHLEKGELEQTLSDISLELRHSQSASPPDVEQLRKALEQKERLVSELQDALETCTHELDARTRDLEEARARLSDQEDIAAHLNHEKADLEQSLAESQKLLQDEIHALELRLQEADQGKSQELEAALAQVRKAEEELISAHSLVDETLERKTQAALQDQERLNEMQANYDRLCQELVEAREQKTGLEGELQAAQSLIDETLESKSQQALELQSQISELHNQIKLLPEQLAQKERELAEFPGQLAELQQQLTDSEQQVAELNEAVKKLQETLESRESELALLRPLVQ